MILNFLAFQIGWFSCVMGAAHGMAAAGSAVALAIIVWHLSQCNAPWFEFRLILCAALFGLVFDSALVWTGWIRYAHGNILPGVAPYWIIVLWMLFSTTLNVSLSWLKRSPLMAVLCGALSGPLAYWGGAKLGALTLPAPVPALIALSLGWAVLTPLLLRIATRFGGYAGRPSPFGRPVDA